MNPPKADELDYIHFLIATQKVFTCTEAARSAPENLDPPAHDAFTRLLTREPPDTGAYKVALGWAYRENALANPNHYAVMFGRAVPGFEPTEEGLRRSERAFGVLVGAVEGCVEVGVVAPSDPRAVASVLWSTAW